MGNMNHKKSVGVIGLGFVGLPLALTFAMKGVRTVGVDTNEQLIAELNELKSHHVESYNGKTLRTILIEATGANNFTATCDYRQAASECDRYIVTVGIPVNNKEPFYEYFNSALISLAKVLKKGDLVLIRSTVPPGTTLKLALPLLEQFSGLQAGDDFYLAYASERIAEGKAFEEFINMPTVLAGYDQESYVQAKQLLSLISEAPIHQGSSIAVVETAKVFENVARDVNIALANQFAEFTRAIDIDINEVVALANTHKRVNLLSPGPGVGGYCLPNAYYYLMPIIHEQRVELPLLELARNLNDCVPVKIVEQLDEMLTKQGKTLSEASIAVYGLAMKDYSNDDRISPAHFICQLLINHGADVYAHDPLVATDKNYEYLNPDAYDVAEKTDAILILTKQHAFENLDFNRIYQSMNDRPILIDTRNLTKREQMEALGYDYYAI